LGGELADVCCLLGWYGDLVVGEARQAIEHVGEHDLVEAAVEGRGQLQETISAITGCAAPLSQ
jgi:hypothetical protein